MKKSKSISFIAMSTIFLLILVVLATWFMPKDLPGVIGPTLSILLYIFVSKTILTGVIAKNVKELQGLNIPTFVAFIPYVQTVMFVSKDKMWLFYTYAASIILALLMPLLLTTDFALNLVGEASIMSVPTIVLGAILVFLGIWRLLHGYIYSGAYAEIVSFVDENRGERHIISRILDIPKRLFFIVPFASMLGTITLLFESSRAVAIKRTYLAKKAKGRA